MRPTFKCARELNQLKLAILVAVSLHRDRVYGVRMGDDDDGVARACLSLGNNQSTHGTMRRPQQQPPSPSAHGAPSPVWSAGSACVDAGAVVGEPEPRPCREGWEGQRGCGEPKCCNEFGVRKSCLLGANRPVQGP